MPMSLLPDPTRRGLLAWLACTPFALRAQSAKTVRIIVPFPPRRQHRHPGARARTLNVEINKALALPDAAQQLAIEGATPVPGSPQVFGALIAREIPRWAAV
jgi:hypothetical protein